MDFEVDLKVDLEFGFSSHPMQGNPRRSLILDSTPWIYGFQVQDSSFFLLELGFWVPVVGGIPDSKDQDFVFHKRNCSGFRIPQAKLSILTWGDSSNTNHASVVKALCITAHCCTLQFRYGCHLCCCGRLRVYETLPISK